MPRPAHPWYRAQKDCWYVTDNGRTVSLAVRGKDSKAEAFKAWATLLAGNPPATPQSVTASPAPSVTPPAATPLTVAVLIDSFLSDVAGRVKPPTEKTYRRFLLPFRDKHSESPAPSVTA